MVQAADIDVSMFEYDAAEYQQGGDDDSHNGVWAGVDDELLWLPFSEEEPSLSPEQLSRMDALADQFEIQRLLDMGLALSSSTSSQVAKQVVRLAMLDMVGPCVKWLPQMSPSPCQVVKVHTPFGVASF